jgi:hypothetical protein
MSESQSGARRWFLGARDPPSLVETWEHVCGVPLLSHVRRIPRDALDGEPRRAEAEQALQALLQFARQEAGPREAHEAEQGIFTRLLPIGWAAMPLDFAQRGTGDRGAAITRADGVTLPQEPRLRGRDDFALVGTFTVARPCYRPAGEAGSCPLDAQGHLPERCDAYGLQEGMPVLAVEPPCPERAAWFAPLFDREGAARVLREVAPEAPRDYASCSAQRPVPLEAREEALLVVSVDGQGVPMLKAEAGKLKAQVGTGEKRPQ